jgi:glycosyltransferase involved in cell wall biosynthesis
LNQITPVRVYAVAFSCEPGRGSEPGVGYNFAEALSRLSTSDKYDIILLTRPHRLDSIENGLKLSIGVHQLSIHAIHLPLWLVACTKRKRVRIAYVVWQWLAMLHIRRLEASSDSGYVVHHITFATEALPTFVNILHRRASIVFGPAGSAQSLNATESSGRLVNMRNYLRCVFGRYNLHRSTLAIASNDSAAAQFKKLGAVNVKVEPNIVVPSNISNLINCEVHDNIALSHEIICVGLLHKRKRIDLALRALAHVRNPEARLLIIGDGPLESELRQLTKDLHLGDRVTFAGKQTRLSTLTLMAKAQVLLHPSRQEGSAWVVGEAQAVGTVPVVVAGSGCEAAVRLGGFGLVVENDFRSLAEGIDRALTESHVASTRWSNERLPRVLDEWYTRGIAQD